MRHLSRHVGGVNTFRYGVEGFPTGHPVVSRGAPGYDEVSSRGLVISCCNLRLSWGEGLVQTSNHA